jgi:membrane protein YdbS with pleckstrin-like domain
MKDNIDFKQYWNKQKIETQEPVELIKKANVFKRKTRFKLIITNLILLATCMLMSFVWFYFQPTFLSTKIGILLCIIAMLVYLAFRNTLAPLLSSDYPELDTKTHLEQLLTLKEKQRFQQTTLLNGYFIFLSFGIGLYMYEYVVRMTLPWAIFSYGIVLFWIAINAFYIRPKTLKKQQTQLNKLITQLKELKEQLND